MTRQTVWILGDQLLRDHPALEVSDPAATSVVMIESEQIARRLPYHRKKLVLIFSAMRHYADHLRDQGWPVDYIRAGTMRDGLRQHVERHASRRIITMAASEYRGRAFQQDHLPRALDLPVDVLPNTQFLVGQFDPYPDDSPSKRRVMEFFYREMRRHFGVLIDGGQPVGGQWNFDADNRKSLPKRIDFPPRVSFPPDEITRQVMDEIEAAGQGVGSVEGFEYGVTHADAERALSHFVEHHLPDFGRYEDAMTTRDPFLFHSGLSPYINLGLLTPMQMIDAAVMALEDDRAPLNSVEGFVRQVIGWREYMHWQYWRHMPGLISKNHWRAARPLPAFFWDAQTDMNCLRHVIGRAITYGYSHHIERLMIVANFCLLAGIDPRAVVDWFRTFYVDAYDWVMQPNVIGMGLNADGGLIATKPYIASANYINRMSDYCQGCGYRPDQRTGPEACPYNSLYWNFLITHEAELRANPRTGPNIFSLRHLDDTEREKIRQEARQFLDGLIPYGQNHE